VAFGRDLLGGSGPVDCRVGIKQERNGARYSQCARRQSPEAASKADRSAPGKLDRVE
jgi:hypothetical protein